MLNTAYDALNLEKDSDFLHAYMQNLLQRVDLYLKDMHEMSEVVGEVDRAQQKSDQQLAQIVKESIYVNEVLDSLHSSFEKAFKSELSEREKIELSLSLNEMIKDIHHSLEVINTAKSEINEHQANNSKILVGLKSSLGELESEISESKNSIEQTQKVSHNLSELSKRMRAYIDKSEFSGKENITMLMNNTDK